MNLTERLIKRIWLYALLLITVMPAGKKATGQTAHALLPYQNKALPVEQRIADLLGRMTKEGKVAQLVVRPVAYA